MTRFALILALLISLQSFAGKIHGKITDTNNQPIPYASITVKGTTKGTSANIDGNYSIFLDPGQYTLVVQHVGYKSVERKVVVSTEDKQEDFQLPYQQYDLGNVVVKQGEDPAYEIIRNAIKKKSLYENELDKFQTDVYVKGRINLRSHPRKFLGQEVDFEDGDTSKHKMIFLSESVARYSVNGENKKTEVLSTRVSGQSDALGLSSPQIFSFYQNMINIGALNPRGFVSPIANNAFNFYRYKFEGSFFENNKMINRIKVIPKRKYEPLFNGYINIIEDEWRIHSTQLSLYKENQMQLADTVVIEQLYVPVGNKSVLKQQTIYSTIKIFGFDITGSFVQVYDNFNLNPRFSKGFFNNTILKYTDSANKKTTAYWDTVRPVPLLQEEVQDYQKKDSLEQVRKDPKYMDSLDRKRNKPNIMALLSTGQIFSSTRKKTSIEIDALLDIVTFNTVEGAVINFSPRYVKRFDEQKRNNIAITPTLRYGLSNERFNANVFTTYTWGKKYPSSVSVGAGRQVLQYDNKNPVNPRANTFTTLNWERNYMKLYEAGVGYLSYTRGIGEGITVRTTFEYQDRIALQNTSLHKWRDFEDRTFTPNITQPAHQAVRASVNVVWQPAAKYIELPNRKINIGSKWPTFGLSYTQGINGILGSDVDYSKWQMTAYDDINLKLLGKLSYRGSVGGFLNATAVYFPDYTHYISNQMNAAAPYLQSFQLMPYYTYSNTASLYTTAHLEYHLNGLFTNKIPGFKKLNWFIVTGSNMLYINNNTRYAEVFIGLENILKIFRVDYVQSFTNRNGYSNTSGIRFSLPLVLNTELN